MSEAASAVANEKTGVVWLLLSLVVIALDHITKFVATSSLDYGIPVPVFAGFNFTLVHNMGAAFSFLSDAGGWQRWFFTILAIGVSIWLVLWLRRLSARMWVECAALSLILGGAIGNVIDRVRLGYVVDFIDVYYGTWHWPAFNIADSAITIGAGLLIWHSLRGAPKQT